MQSLSEVVLSANQEEGQCQADYASSAWGEWEKGSL